ncbi:MAG: exosortase/archaeosortase family protein [Candidatus Auribacter fodinae]|uniref:Exosortase/archaeosortase family protein n=1 Tax=Candidatus Auribacter fodinae TaxID=2093366 RepID=A0A3A4R8B1_9BACT|nr:MAG: exosortase/archaeosortase family protein [Candidatus Auribacter fodinae]
MDYMDKNLTLSEWLKTNKMMLIFVCLAIIALFYTPFAYMVTEWRARIAGSYTPGPFVPLVSGYIIWQKRHELAKLVLSPTKWGYFVICLALILHVLAQIGDLQRISIMAFIIFTGGIMLVMLGGQVTYRLLFPLCFLVFMVPMEFLDGLIGVKLRMIASQWAAIILDLLGYSIIRIGTQIEMIGIFSFDVAAPCSGLKSLVSLTALGIAFAYLTQKSQWKRALIAVSALPIAIIANVFRVVLIGLIAASLGKDMALGFFHSFSGFFLFTFALLALTGIGRLLSWQIKNL